MSKAKQTRGGIPIFCRFDKLIDASKLRPNPVNPYRHPKNQIDRLVAVIKANGWRNPVIVSKRSGLITKGHARHTAGLQLADTVPVEIQDYASEQKERDDLLADNRIAELAEADDELLAKLLKDANAESVVAAGYLPAEVEDILSSLNKGNNLDAEPRIDEAGELKKQWGTKGGQIWKLGEHRIMCGDSTKIENLGFLMESEKAHLVFTDPPYGVGYDGGTTIRTKLKGDESTSLYAPCCVASRDFSDNAAPLYLWHAGIKGIAAAAAAAAAAAGYEIRCELVWNKNQAQYGALSAQYKQKHEPCYYCFKKGKTPRWFGPTNEITVWDINRASVNDFHPTQKPVELAARAIRNNSKLNHIVADWFLGSGCTLIACEQLGRKCRAMEIDPGYVAVSIQRWVDATGKKPKLLN